MPVRSRHPNEIVAQTMPLLLLGVGLFASNNYFTVIDDEARILDAATQPVRTILNSFLSASGQHEYPPIFEMILHFWLRWTGGNFQYLRVPAIVLFLAGLFLLGRAARYIGGPAAARAVIWIGVLSPFGFHYDRLNTSYSFSFFLVAGVTFAYLRYLDVQSIGRWTALFLFSALLLWTNYLGWAVLACLAADQLLRKHSGERVIPARVMAGTLALLVLICVPVFRAFRGELGADINFHHSFTPVLINAAFNIYSLFVSESMAPWHWVLSMPAGLAVVVCVVLVLWNEKEPPRRFLFYSGVLILLMDMMGVLATRRLFLVAPWVLISVGIAIATITSRWVRVVLAFSLLIVAGIGWYGIRTKTYYSAPPFLEPWLQVAGDAADRIHGGATVVANSPSFFFYLTYILRAPNSDADWKFSGALPDSLKYPNVMSAEEWLAAGHPLAPTVIWVRGEADPQTYGPMDAAAHQLDVLCGSRISRLMMHDQGFPWKQRFLPQPGELQWRVEVREYDCASGTSPEIFRIPAR